MMMMVFYEDITELFQSDESQSKSDRIALAILSSPKRTKLVQDWWNNHI